MIGFIGKTNKLYHIFKPNQINLFIYVNFSNRIIRQHIFLLAATNMPWDLDIALLRRFEKRILVPMPDEVARRKLMKLFLSLHFCQLDEEDYVEYAKETEGYNGADIKLLCKEAAMRPIRIIFDKLETSQIEDTRLSRMKSTSSKSSDINVLLRKYPVVSEDLKKSLEMTKPSTESSLQIRYKEWSNSHGAI